jgi:hypothetical protein
MAIKVRVEGVGILSFPDGTSRDVISDTVRRYASEKAPATIAEMRRREEQPGFNPTQAQIMRQAIDEQKALYESGASSIFENKESPFVSNKNLLRYGVPIGVALATGGASIPIQIAAGAGSSLVGEAGAQTIEKFDEDQNYRLGEIAGSTIRGGIPVFRGFSGATRATIGAGALGGLAAGAVEGKIENPLEDPLSSAGGVVKEGLIGAAIPGALATLGAGARGGAGMINRALENIQDVERIGPGTRATIGQAFPVLAGFEKRIAARTGGEELNRQLLEQSDAITSAVRGLQGKAEPTETVIGKILNQFGITDPSTVARIADESKGLISAEQAVVNARTAAQRSLAQEALQDAESAFRRVVNREQQILTALPFQSAKMGTAIENTLQDTKKAIQDHSDILYTPVQFFENNKVFNFGLKAGKNEKSVEQAVLDLKKNHPYLQSGDENRRFIPYLDELNSVLENQSPASLSQLRAIRQKLYDLSSSSDPIISKAKKDLRDVANLITKSIDYQGSYLLKPADYQSLKTANKFWSEFTPQLDNFGVSQAFKEGSEELGQMAELYTGRVSQQGAEAPAFKNAVQLLSDLRKLGVRKVPDPQSLNDIVKSGIIENSINKTTQQLDLSTLAANLNKLERTSPGSLSQLGFGNTTELNRFVSFIDRLPAAQQQGPEAVLALLQHGTPASLRFLSSAVNQLPDVATTRTVMRALERRAVAGSKTAQTTLTSIRAKAIEELLLKASEGGAARVGTPGATGMTARMESLKDMVGIDSVEKLETILGRNLFDIVQDRIIPGFRVINQAKQRAGGAGATVGGSVFEKLGTTPGIGSLTDFLGYQGLAAALGHGAGATGMVKRRDQLERLARLAELPPALLQQTVAKYTRADESE